MQGWCHIWHKWFMVHVLWSLMTYIQNNHAKWLCVVDMYCSIPIKICSDKMRKWEDRYFPINFSALKKKTTCNKIIYVFIRSSRSLHLILGINTQFQQLTVNQPTCNYIIHPYTKRMILLCFWCITYFHKNCSKYTNALRVYFGIGAITWMSSAGDVIERSWVNWM